MKKQIKNFIKFKLNEFVDGDGGDIDGKVPPNSDSEITTNTVQTSDDFADATIQPNMYFFSTYPFTKSNRFYDLPDKLEIFNEEEIIKVNKKTIEDLINKKIDDLDLVNVLKDKNLNNKEDLDLKDLLDKNNGE